ncbi:MAG: hypothetical protein IJK68_07495 [Muribaculaceae bacterium]|nr:hypothetical protein [Muribaculaceae bacterium]
MKTAKHNTKKKRIVAIVAFMAVALMAVLVYAIPGNIDEPKRGTRVVGGRANIKNIYHFDDVNDTQLVAAQEFGIEPMKTRDEIDSSLVSTLSKVETSNVLFLEKLTHSVPYLTQGAGDLLNTIATNFQDKLRDRGLAQYQIVVTSLLRTEDDVKRLQKVNRNAVRKSCHMYGTTFDIAYNCFQKVDSLADFEGDDASHKVLVNMLGETLRELRDDKRCYVKYERRQPCFHITSRY